MQKTAASNATARPADSPQLGLDFEAATASPPASRPSMAWSPPSPVLPSSGGLGALGRACHAKNAKLVLELLALPIAWDIDRREDFASNGKAPPDASQAPTPLAHLLAGHAYQPGGWGQPSPEDNELTTRAALAMVGRGADFLAFDRSGFCPLTQAAYSRRGAFIEALTGHPDFVHAKLSGLRVGSRVSNAAAQPMDLLGHAIGAGMGQAAKALIESAKLPVNELDSQGLLPIGHCQDIATLNLLIDLGADCALPDAHGMNAMARVQQASDTSKREMMLTRVAAELKKGARKDPSIMASLQAQNIAALLEAAQNSPKSSLLKTISAFKFDAAKARDPRTLTTPLMAAARGGRMASAEHLIQAGCSLNDQDIHGVSAGALLLANHGGSNGPRPSEVCERHGAKIDFSLRSTRGWPAALEAAAWMGERGASDYGYGVAHSTRGAFEAALKARAAAGLPAPGPEHFVGNDGATMMEAYASAPKAGPRWHDEINMLGEMSLRMGVPHGEAMDGVLAACLSLASSTSSFSSPHHDAGRALAWVNDRIKSFKLEYAPKAAAVLARRPELREGLAKNHPHLHSAMEASEILASSLPSRDASAKAPRL